MDCGGKPPLFSLNAFLPIRGAQCLLHKRYALISEYFRTRNAIGSPTQKMCITTPISISWPENGRFTVADSATTPCMKKYTATPYKTPETAACCIRKGNFRLTRKYTAAAENAMTK